MWWIKNLVLKTKIYLGGCYTEDKTGFFQSDFTSGYKPKKKPKQNQNAYLITK